MPVSFCWGDLSRTDERHSYTGVEKTIDPALLRHTDMAIVYEVRHVAQ